MNFTPTATTVGHLTFDLAFRSAIR